MIHPDTSRFFDGASRKLLQVCPAFRDLAGWLRPEEGELLFQAAGLVRDAAIVEIGSAAGKSTVALSKGATYGHGAPVFAIDPHEEFIGLYGGQYGPDFRRQFYETMLATGCWQNVRLVNLSSEILTGWNVPVGLLWIDGDHRYQSVLRDVNCWLGHVVRGGFIIFDDTNQPNSAPRRIIDDLSAQRLVEELGTIRKVTAVRKI